MDFPLPVCPPAEVGMSPERLARIRRFLESKIKSGQIAGVNTLVARRGRIAHLDTSGMADIENGKPMRPDTLFRIASMTKPITSIATMTLFEEGHFLLNDPIGKFLPELANLRVLVPSSHDNSYLLAPAKRPITIRHLLTHTSGFTYPFDGVKHVSDLYLKASIPSTLCQTEMTLAEMVSALGTLPLVHQPGERFTYSISTDVLGRLVEVVSGLSYDEFLRTRLFVPLGMSDTHFYLPDEKVPRLASLYSPDTGDGIKKTGDEIVTDGTLSYSGSFHHKGPRTYFAGGAGLVSTILDYARFLQMLLNNGEFDGARILSRKTIELVTRNHIGNIPFDAGWKFGLGFAVHENPGASGSVDSAGMYHWSGFYFTEFWVDPSEEMFAIFMAQSVPRPTGVKEFFHPLVYQAIAD